MKLIINAVLSWLSKNIVVLIKELYDFFINKREESRLNSKLKKLESLNKQLEIAKRNRDEKEIVRLTIAITSIEHSK